MLPPFSRQEAPHFYSFAVARGAGYPRHHFGSRTESITPEAYSAGTLMIEIHIFTHCRLY
jgi:hypothetical protein